MQHRRSWFNWFVLLSFTILTGMLAGCASDSSNTESLNIYEIWATNASFTPVAGDQTSRKFQLTLSNQFTEDDDILYFTNRGAQQAGTFKLLNLINNVWPRVYGSVAPNALLQGKTAKNETVYISCIIEKPVLNKATGQLSFSITYLDGRRPSANLALTDLELIITNNSATVQPAVWSHNLDGDSATLEPAKNTDGTVIDGTYTFRVQKAFGSILGVTCAPQRKTETVATKSYFDGWNKRFGSNPPNASISFTDSNLLVSQVFTATLSNPVYDEATGNVSFTAKNVYFPFGAIGKTTLTIKEPTVFIDAGPGGFPSFDDNVFSIQVRNSTSEKITVWLVPNKPPCSEKVANDLKCDNSKPWDSLADAFTQSKTKFYKITILPNQAITSTPITPSASISLDPAQILRIVPPIGDTGTPEWWYTEGKSGISTGTGLWVTKSSVTSPVTAAPNNGGQIEFNVQGGTRWPNPLDQLVNYDISGVNGMHFNSSITFEGTGCGDTTNCGCNGGKENPYRACMTNLADYVEYDDRTNNDGCPYAITRTADGVKTCPNPKYWPYDGLDNRKKPDWVVAPKNFTVNDLNSYATFMSETQTAVNGWLDYTTNVLKQQWPAHYAKDNITGYVLSDAAIGAVNSGEYLKAKRGYHVWWATNPVALNWLKYYQVNSKGNCDAYGWAYDEQKWDPSNPDTFDKNQNPPTNPSVTVDISCPSKPVPGTKNGKYLNIDIFYIM